MLKFFVILAVAVAFAAAEDVERTKKDVVVPYAGYHGVSPLIHGVAPIVHDDGKYYPGKYEKPIVPTVYSAGLHGSAIPYYGYGSYPYTGFGGYTGYTGYTGYPYYGGVYGGNYLYGKHIV